MMTKRIIAHHKISVMQKALSSAIEGEACYTSSSRSIPQLAEHSPSD